jgi:hypothetical protein
VTLKEEKNMFGVGTKAIVKKVDPAGPATALSVGDRILEIGGVRSSLSLLFSHILLPSMRIATAF